MNLEDLKKCMLQLVAAFPAVRLVYLFGSRVTGPTGPESDYDLGILLTRQADAPALRPQLSHALTVMLQTDQVDVVLLHQAPLELAFAVISQGRVVYERDVATRVEYEAYAMGRYFDYLPVLRAQRAEILRGGDVAKRVQRYREALGRTERTLGEIRAAQKQGSGRI